MNSIRPRRARMLGNLVLILGPTDLPMTPDVPEVPELPTPASTVPEHPTTTVPASPGVQVLDLTSTSSEAVATTAAEGVTTLPRTGISSWGTTVKGLALVVVGGIFRIASRRREDEADLETVTD